MNTSGVDRCGDFLPSADIFRRFRELGGEIVTGGSDYHGAFGAPPRIGYRFVDLPVDSPLLENA